METDGRLPLRRSGPCDLDLRYESRLSLDRYRYRVSADTRQSSDQFPINCGRFRPGHPNSH